jgi:predicted unusual protein kinase regulating ubiquinone biosynthesis (AarF/ABC1/UbiB family)
VRPLLVVWRLVPFVVAFLRDRRWLIIAGPPRRMSEAQHRERAQRLTATVAALGPAFIKLAQVFASRADIIPEPYLGEIGALTDRVPALSVEAIGRVIEQEFGTPPEQLFDRFDPEPLGSASLGQVHRASLAGREVVVKVLRPGVEELIATDLAAAFRVLFILNVLFPNHHTRAITNIVREFAKRIDEEIDFREEARNAEIIRANFIHDPRVAVPEVITGYVRRRVLVLEYMEGTRVDRLQERFARGELALPRVLGTIVEVYVQMMLVHGIFHADPHPGNILVSPDGRVVLIDFGMVVRVGQETRSRLLQTIMAAVRQDVDGVVAGFYELGLLDPEVDRGTVRDAARALMAVAFTPNVRNRQIQDVLNDVLSTFYRWPITLPSELVYFGRAAALVEGIGFRYDADFNGVQFATPIVSSMKGQLLQTMLGGDSREVLRDWMTEFGYVARELRDVLRRAGRDELRVRAHPRDVLELERHVSRQTRRIMLGLLASTLAIIATLLFMVHRNIALLLLSLLMVFLFYLVVLLLPLHLLSNPFRGYRRWR